MKINYLVLAALMSVVMTAASCSDIDSGQTPDGDPLSLSVEVSDVSDTSAFVSVDASDEVSTYYVSVITQAEYDLLGANDDALAEEDREFFKYLARKEGKTYEQVVSFMLNAGSRQEKFINLIDNTDYLAYAYAMDKHGNAIGEMIKSSFRTAVTPDEPVLFTMEKQYLADKEASILIRPSADTVWYTTGFATQDIVNQYGGDVKGLKLYALEYLIQQADFFSLDVKDVIDILCLRGESLLESDELVPDMKYYAYAVAMSLDARPISEASVLEFNTPQEGMIGMEIEFKVLEYTNSGVDIEMTPSDGTNSYFYRIFPADFVDEFRDDTEFLEWVLEDEGYDIRHLLVKGKKKTSVNGRLSNSDYYIIAFGYSTETERNNTPLFKFKFTTPVPELNFEFGIELVKMGVAWTITPSDRSAFYVYGILDRNEYDSFGGSVQEYFKDLVNAYMESNPGIDMETAIRSIGDSGDNIITREYLYSATEYYVWAAPVDRSCNFVCEPKIQQFTSKEHVVDESITVTPKLSYYDGQEISAASFIYSDYADKAVMPVEVEVSSEDVSWVSCFYMGDIENDESITDDMLRYDLINNKSWMLMYSQVFVLPWDTEVTLCIAPINDALECGKVYRKAMTLTKEGVSDVTEFKYMYNTPVDPFPGLTGRMDAPEHSVVKEKPVEKAGDSVYAGLADRNELRKSETVRFSGKMVKERLF